MKKVVSVIYSLSVAGAENVCLNISSNINKEKFEAYIITIFDEAPLLNQLQNQENVKVISLGVPLKSRYWIFSPKVFLKFRKIVKSINPYAIHSHLWGVGTYLLLTIIGLGIKNRIATIHTSGGHYKSSYWFSKIDRNVEKWTYKLLNFRLVCVSEEVRKMILQKLKILNPIKINNGVDLNYFNPIGNKQGVGSHYPVIVHVGRFLKAKNHWDMVRSLPALKEKYPNFKMCFIGAGVEENLKEYCEENQILDNVRFLGVTNNVVKYLNQADIGLFQSTYEGLALALLEMMSCELPVVISDIPVFKEITEKGNCAKITSLHRIEEISESIIELAGDKKQMKELGKEGRRIIAEYFSQEKMVSAYEELYEKTF
ncbi:glycosyltransferase [Marinifilum fragile]|uniref:glycosyltransferase n=1 Tax=Marinifilum fragile TaxID=570161 RepID=UPI002AA8FE8F|nr:glycosyltransferase [Marinifilum fragile]